MNTLPLGKWSNFLLYDQDEKNDRLFVQSLMPFFEKNKSYKSDANLIMAVDYGKKHWGLAISDNTFTLARPLEKIANKNGLANLIKYLSKYNVCALIWGMPGSYTESGPDPMKAHVIEHYHNLKKQIQNTNLLSAGQYFIDERSSSKEAMDQLKEMGFNLKKSIELKDQTSAAYILQLALDLFNKDAVITY